MESSTVISFIWVIVGISMAFMGYRNFRDLQRLWGFILFGLFAVAGLRAFVPQAQEFGFLAPLVALVVGGIIGAVVSVPLGGAIQFLTGGALGAVLGILAGALLDSGFSLSNFTNGATLADAWKGLSFFSALAFPPIPQSTLQIVFMAGGFLVFGVLTVLFPRFMISLSTAFLGGAAILTGVNELLITTNTFVINPIILTVIWVILGWLGIFIQFQTD